MPDASGAAGVLAGDGGGPMAGGNSSTLNVDPSAGGKSAECVNTCSLDFGAVIDCHGNKVVCDQALGCDAATGTCAPGCEAAKSGRQSVGCEYYATLMDLAVRGFTKDHACFAAFVANTWHSPAHITVDYGGESLSVARFARIPRGSGATLSYEAFDNTRGLLPGEVVILFLSGPEKMSTADGPSVICPAPTAVPDGVAVWGTSGTGHSFHIESDVPVVAYQMAPYGGGSSTIAGASLLLPTSVWDGNYIAVDAYGSSMSWEPEPSLNIVSMHDDTHVQLLPVAPVVGGGGLPAGPANQAVSFTLAKGEHAQFTQKDELTGSVITSDQPVGLMAGHECMAVPDGVEACDHGEQMVPPIRALGHEYVGVPPRPRFKERTIWRVIGAVDDTVLSWSSNVGGPTSLRQGQVAEFMTKDPFVVTSQDAAHPFLLFEYMSGCSWPEADKLSVLQMSLGCRGDPDFVISVPPEQYLSRYVFFADPSYPETNLVVVREKDDSGNFNDVTLDCAGVIGGWQAVGNYEWARLDLSTGDFNGVGNCSTGPHEMHSDGGRFGLWIWGWGTELTYHPLTSPDTEAVSYGYPAGMNVRPLSQVVVPATPK